MAFIAKIKKNMGFDVKITTFSRILDLIAPFSCRGCGRLGSLLCECCKNYNIQQRPKICPRCRKTQKKCSCKTKVYAVSYRMGVMMKLTEEYKYKSIRKTAEVLAEMMDATIPSEFGKGEEVIVVPLPTISRHIRERGFDHTLLLAKELAKRRKWKVEKALVRKNKTVQVGASEVVRRRQASEAYEACCKLDAKRTYLLVDDVWTTGASMEAAILALKKAGAKKMASAVILMSGSYSEDSDDSSM